MSRGSNHRSALPATAWFVLALAAGLGGTAGLVLGAQQVGRIAFADATPSWIALLLPLLAGGVLESVSVAAGGMAGIEVSHRVRCASLDHCLAIDPDQAEVIGAGGALGRALDGDLIGSFLVATGPVAVIGSIELVVGSVISARASDGGVRMFVISSGVLLLLAVGHALLEARRRWTRSRQDLTSELVERLIGQRTVALQEDTAGFRTALRPRLSRYRRRERALDATTIGLTAAALGVGVTLVLLALGLRTRSTPVEAAIALAAGLLVTSGMLRLSRVADDVAGIAVARRSVRELADLRRPPVPEASPAAGLAGVRGVVGGYQRGRPVVGPVDWDIAPGEKWLLTGASGSGKSTLIEILDGRRAPAAGQVMRRPGAVLARVPQAGDDHVFHASLLFNVLMGRAWPPADDDIDDALEVLDDLGLGPLLERMPSGILQPVGDGGWLLSAGEAARVRLARALVSRPDLLVLDETFAPLDANSLSVALHAAQKWASALLVVAHPELGERRSGPARRNPRRSPDSAPDASGAD